MGLKELNTVKVLLGMCDLKVLAEKTGVNYKTLYNYRSGITPVESMPYTLVMGILEHGKSSFDNTFDLLSPSGHLALRQDSMTYLGIKELLFKLDANSGKLPKTWENDEQRYYSVLKYANSKQFASRPGDELGLIYIFMGSFKKFVDFMEKNKRLIAIPLKDWLDEMWEKRVIFIFTYDDNDDVLLDYYTLNITVGDKKNCVVVGVEYDERCMPLEVKEWADSFDVLNTKETKHGFISNVVFSDICEDLGVRLDDLSLAGLIAYAGMECCKTENKRVFDNLVKCLNGVFIPSTAYTDYDFYLEFEEIATDDMDDIDDLEFDLMLNIQMYQYFIKVLWQLYENKFEKKNRS